MLSTSSTSSKAILAEYALRSGRTYKIRPWCRRFCLLIRLSGRRSPFLRRLVRQYVERAAFMRGAVGNLPELRNIGPGHTARTLIFLGFNPRAARGRSFCTYAFVEQYTAIRGVGANDAMDEMFRISPPVFIYGRLYRVTAVSARQFKSIIAVWLSTSAWSQNRTTCQSPRY